MVILEAAGKIACHSMDHGQSQRTSHDRCAVQFWRRDLRSMPQKVVGTKLLVRQEERQDNAVHISRDAMVDTRQCACVTVLLRPSERVSSFLTAHQHN